MFETILLPTDGSRRAKQATNHALDVARHHDSTVHAVYIIDMGEMGFAAVPGDIAETKDRLKKHGDEVLADVERRADDAGVECVTAVESGIPHEVIVEYAAEHDVDLIVMGKHGYLDADSHLLGSVTQRVMERTDVPVQAL